MITITATIELYELESLMHEGAKETLQVINEHHKRNDFEALINNIFSPLPYEKIGEKYMKTTENDFTVWAEDEQKERSWSKLHDWLRFEPENIYYLLGIPMDEDGEPLPYDEGL